MAVSYLIDFISFVAVALMILLFLRAMLVRMVHTEGFLYGIYTIIAFTTDFIVKPCEKISKMIAPDGRNFAIFIAFFAVIIIRSILIYIISLVV